MATIETKIAKNGVKLYYVDGKRTSGEVALQAAADNRENLFTIEYATRHNAYFTNGENQVYESTSKAVLKELELKIDEYQGFTVKLHTIGWVEICKLFNKDYAKSLINKIENAFIRGEYGVKIDTYGKVSILPAPVVEPEPDDYAINPDALEVAVNAEIQNANTAKINDLKWEIRYTEGSINDLDKNHIAHFPNDQSLQERRAELVNELAALKAQLADLLPNEIQAANNAEPDTNELSDQEVAEIKRRSQINAIKSRIATYERAIERQYDQELENSLIAAKAQLAEIEPDNTPQVDRITGIKEEQPMTIEIPAEGTHEFTIGDDTVCFFNGKFHSVFSAKYHMAIVRDLVGCFSYCIYNDGDTEVFNVGEHAVSYDNFMETLHQRGNREKLLALRQDYIITDHLSENNSSLWYVNGKRSSQVKVWNLLQSYGLTLAEFLAEEEAYINERVAASCKKIAIKKQADFLADKIKRDAQPSDDNVFNLLPDLDQLNDVNLDVNALEATIEKITSIYDAVQEASYSAQAELVDYKDAIQKQNAINHGLIDACDVAAWKLTVSRKQVKVFKSIAFKLKQEEKIILDELVHLEIKLERLKDTAPFDLSDDGELIDPPTVCYPLTIEEEIDSLNHNINWAIETLATMQGDIYSDDWQDWTRAELEQAIEDWTEERDDLIIKSGKLTFNHKQKKNIRDSLNRAIKQCIRNRIGYLKSHNSKMEKYEYELLCLLQGARRELEVA